MSFPSTYKLMYHAMSDEDRQKLEEDVSFVLMNGTESVRGFVTREVEKAVTGLYDRLNARAWDAVIKENSDAYSFIVAIQDQIWEAMKQTSPTTIESRYMMPELVESWQKNYPGDWEVVVGEVAAGEIKELRERVLFLEETERSRRSF